MFFLPVTVTTFMVKIILIDWAGFLCTNVTFGLAIVVWFG